MKTLITNQITPNYLPGQQKLHTLNSPVNTNTPGKPYQFNGSITFPAPSLRVEDRNLINPSALYQMASGQLPDLWEVCYRLYHTFFEKHATYNALQFIPVLRGIRSMDPMQLERFMENPETNHVLIQNELLKVVLIHWKPGKSSNVHGHPSGGCVFKVLHGQIEEKRFTPDPKTELLAVSTYERGGMGYIDDQMAYHAVGNPFDSSAISLHVYTPGIKKS
jgi:hypothetical protein